MTYNRELLTFTLHLESVSMKQRAKYPCETSEILVHTFIVTQLD